MKWARSCAACHTVSLRLCVPSSRTTLGFQQCSQRLFPWATKGEPRAGPKLVPHHIRGSAGYQPAGAWPGSTGRFCCCCSDVLGKLVSFVGRSYRFHPNRPTTGKLHACCAGFPFCSAIAPFAGLQYGGWLSRRAFPAALGCLETNRCALPPSKQGSQRRLGLHFLIGGLAVLFLGPVVRETRRRCTFCRSVHPFYIHVDVCSTQSNGATERLAGGSIHDCTSTTEARRPRLIVQLCGGTPETAAA